MNTKIMNKIFFCLAMAASITASAQTKKIEVKPYVNKINPDAKFTRSGSIIIVSADATHKTRAFSAFSSGTANAQAYAESANSYKRAFGDGVNVYCMPIPIACEFYSPDAASQWCRTQSTVLNAIYSCLSDSVQGVDVYTTLGQHAREDIYSRTDHHWLPLGAYYAAKEFARVAKVPFKEIPLQAATDSTDAKIVPDARNEWYEQRVVRNFVGTMYSFSRNYAVKNAPEDFYYWVPTRKDYDCRQVVYTLDKTRKRVIGESEEKEFEFFRPMKDGASSTYCTFIGGDTFLTHSKAMGNNGRKLLILKDSFGNAIPAFLLYSFEDIYIVDCRYFTKNIREYVAENGITDVLFANNISHALSAATTNMYAKYLIQ